MKKARSCDTTKIDKSLALKNQMCYDSSYGHLMIFRVLKCFCDIRLSHEQAVLKLLTSEIASRILY